MRGNWLHESLVSMGNRPPDNKPILVITIDCECDKSRDWTSSNPLTFLSVKEGIPRRLQAIFKRFGAVPTYLLSNEVMEDTASVEILKALDGEFELGTHLHGDYVPPGQIFSRYDGTLTSAYQCDYPEDVERAKLDNLTALFRDKFGCSPVSFRAGRFGAGAATIRILEDLGYKVDSSVLPGMRERTPKGEIRFIEAPIFPYYPSRESIVRKGKGTVMEVPVTVYRHPVMERFFPGMTFVCPKTILECLLNRLFSSIILRPTYFSAKEMVDASNRILSQKGLIFPVLNMMFHSMEVIPGASPYTSDIESVDQLLVRIAEFIEFWVRKGGIFSSLSELPVRAKDYL